MYDNKPWHQSTGVWGSIIVLVGAAFAFLGLNPSGEDMAYLAREAGVIVPAVGGVMALMGRLYATRGIGKPLEPLLSTGVAGTLEPVKWSFEDRLSELLDLLKTALPAIVQPAQGPAIPPVVPDTYGQLIPVKWPTPPAGTAPTASDPAPLTQVTATAPDTMSLLLKVAAMFIEEMKTNPSPSSTVPGEIVGGSPDQIIAPNPTPAASASAPADAAQAAPTQPQPTNP